MGRVTARYPFPDNIRNSPEIIFCKVACKPEENAETTKRIPYLLVQQICEGSGSNPIGECGLHNSGIPDNKGNWIFVFCIYFNIYHGTLYALYSQWKDFLPCNESNQSPAGAGTKESTYI